MLSQCQRLSISVFSNALHDRPAIISYPLLNGYLLLIATHTHPERAACLQANAEKHLPFLEKQAPSEIYARDTFGNTVMFKFRFWINNQSRMYLLEGTQKIRNAYRLGPGDVIQFGKNAAGELIVAGRKGTQSDMHRKPPPPRGSSPALTGQKPAAKRRRAQPAGAAQSAAMLHTDANTLYFLPVKDGVFRAVVDGSSDDPGRVTYQNGVFTVILNVCGELYQAFFDSQAAALEAFNAAGEFQT